MNHLRFLRRIVGHRDALQARVWGWGGVQEVNRMRAFGGVRYQFSVNNKKDYYSILGVSKSATKDQIKKAYLDLAKKYHPDTAKATEDADMFKDINEAYQVLSNQQKRNDYDQKLKDEQQQKERNSYEGYTDAYRESQKQYQNNQYYDSSKYKTYQEYQHMKKDFDEGNLAEEGFFNTLKRAPELIVISLLMLAVVLRWMYLLREHKKQLVEQSKRWNEAYDGEQQFEDRDKVMRKLKKQTIQLLDEDCKGRSLQELASLQATGIYVLPEKYQKKVQAYNEFMDEEDSRPVERKKKRVDPENQFNFKKKYDSPPKEQDSE